MLGLVTTSAAVTSRSRPPKSTGASGGCANASAPPSASAADDEAKGRVRASRNARAGRGGGHRGCRRGGGCGREARSLEAAASRRSGAAESGAASSHMQPSRSRQPVHARALLAWHKVSWRGITKLRKRAQPANALRLPCTASHRRRRVPPRLLRRGRDARRAARQPAGQLGRAAKRRTARRLLRGRHAARRGSRRSLWWRRWCLTR